MGLLKNPSTRQKRTPRTDMHRLHGWPTSSSSTNQSTHVYASPDLSRNPTSNANNEGRQRPGHVQQPSGAHNMPPAHPQASVPE
mmetsp:Transcript_13051/g.37922  ORF Transcript_13051/g.37922 Transcript_13051/m.37922 type:complete len:84 (+) Transcript_13051:143-394(+)|eukprot:350371-Chlamydomonas_euryale.AAC.2